MITIFGILVSLTPVFVNFKLTDFQFYWPVIFLLGNVPGVLMNVIEEWVFRDTKQQFDNIYLLAWESLYQLVTVMVLFWTDLIPGFGTSESFSQWVTEINDGFACFFTPNLTENDTCQYCLLLGLIFTAAYCFSYIFGAVMMKNVSAISNAMVSVIAPTVAVFFWICFPSLNKWANPEHPEHSPLEVGTQLVALPIIIIGIILYRKEEEKQVIEKEGTKALVDDFEV